jgi:hypothetical protein
MARVTIGLPCYNEAPFIEATLLAQTDDDLTIIICDNASDDGTWDIIQRVVAADPRVQLHRAETNLGARVNFRRAMELSTSPYFMWMGAHDVLDPDYVKKLRLLLDAAPSAVMACADSVMMARDGSRIPGEPVLSPPDVSSPNVIERLQAVIWDTQRCDHLHGLMRREFVHMDRIFDTRAGDMVLLADLALSGPCLHVPKLMFYRRKVRDDEGPAQMAARLKEMGVMNPAESIAASMTAVRDAHLALLPHHAFTPVASQQLRTVICQGFKDRHSVPWDATESATWTERLQLRFTKGDAHQRVIERIEQRIASEQRPSNAETRRRLERELARLLKENHRLRRRKS